MEERKEAGQEALDRIVPRMWTNELERTLSRYHLTAAWVALIFDPVFAVTDYFNLPGHWRTMLAIRLIVSLLILTTILVGRKRGWHSYFIVSVPFLLISLQNAYVYQFIEAKDLLGQNLNYMALFVGAAFFVAWRWTYSAVIIALSVIATAIFIGVNPGLSLPEFFVNGGLLLLVVQVFAGVLINTRFKLLSRELRARLALRAQAEQIKQINENLEALVQARTQELQKKNKALEEYAFINAHKLRAPVASILGLYQVFKTMELPPATATALEHLNKSVTRLDEIVAEITRTVEG